jgi:hypothetical protein
VNSDFVKPTAQLLDLALRIPTLGANPQMIDWYPLLQIKYFWKLYLTEQVF